MDVKFPETFVFGASTAAYQIEGAAMLEGKGESIWDHFTHTPGKIHNGDNGNIACDHYHLYPTDIRLMQALGLQAYRFSTAWTRFFPDGKGKANLKGRDFYNRLVDGLLENNIVPWLCFYHWDLPQSLQDKGGWANRDTAYYFTDYVSYVAEHLGDRVRYFALLNAPNVHAISGHLLGIHAPGLRDFQSLFSSLHHLNLATGLGIARLRSQGTVWKLGTILSLQPVYAATDKDDDIEARNLFDALWNRSVLDPLFKGSYPEQLQGMLEDIVQAGDLGQIHQALDFLGMNYYQRILIEADPASVGGLRPRRPARHAEQTAMGWEVYPQGMLEQLLELKHDYGNPEVFITGNGAAYQDVLSSRGIDDQQRIRFLQSHLQCVQQALAQGVHVRGYFVGSLLDNFEWAEGYAKRFGLIYTDYANQKRIAKASYTWYQKVIRDYGFNVTV